MIKYINLILFAGMIVMNYLATALPLNNKTTGELSDSFPNLFVPAGITFSIWGIIYLLVLAYCVVQFTGFKPDRYIKYQLAVWNIMYFKCTLDCDLALWQTTTIPVSYAGNACSTLYISIAIKDLP